MTLSTFVGRVWAVVPSPVKGLYRHLPEALRVTIVEKFITRRSGAVVIRSGPAKGMQMEISPRTELGYFWGNHEPDLQNALPEVIRPGMTIFDIGANAGYFALVLAQLVGKTGKVVAFEPNPSIVTRLRRNVELNRLQERVTVEAMAVADFDGDATFSFALSDMQGRFADLPYVPQGAPTTSVPCTTVDSYVRRSRLVPDVIMIDVEHAEGRVLRGMRGLLSSRAPILFVEMHGRAAIAEAYPELVDQGYSLIRTGQSVPVRSIEDITELGHYVAHPRM